MKKWTHMASIAVVLALGFALGSLSSDGQADSPDLRWVAGEFPEEFLRSMEESSAAFLRKDMEATRAHITEDFATYAAGSMTVSEYMPTAVFQYSPPST